MTAEHGRLDDEFVPPRYPVDEPPTYRARCACGWTGPERYRGITGQDWQRHTTEIGESIVTESLMGMGCTVHAHRDWTPLDSHHIWPKGMGGPDVPANRVVVCPNGHGAIHEYIRRLIRHNGAVPTDEARHFGRKVKALAIRGWQEAGRPMKGGAGE